MNFGGPFDYPAHETSHPHVVAMVVCAEVPGFSRPKFAKKLLVD